jgi:CPA2 family monovalent cation:H+ antiporter-2
MMVMLLGLILKKLNQPYIIAYIVTGIVLGPFGLKLITDYQEIEKLGEIGLVILMFFIGMEISLPNFVKKWKIALIGTGSQILFSLLLAYLLSLLLNWPLNRWVLIGFIISISSSAVVIKLIESSKNPEANIHQDVISILLTQDILIVPMLIILNLLSGEKIDLHEVVIQVIGGIIIILLMAYVLKKREIKLPFEDVLKNDHELQVFASFIACFGIALFTSTAHLSPSLGALVSGMVINATQSGKWLHNSLHPFRVLFVTLFFISIGLLINIDFLVEHLFTVSLLVIGVYLSNHVINMIALRFLGNNMKESFYGASLLAQIGEFSFVLALYGYQQAVISQYSYQLTILVIAITILISPLWIAVGQKVVGGHVKVKVDL